MPTGHECQNSDQVKEWAISHVRTSEGVGQEVDKMLFLFLSFFFLVLFWNRVGMEASSQEPGKLSFMGTWGGQTSFNSQPMSTAHLGL